MYTLKKQHFTAVL